MTTYHPLPPIPPRHLRAALAHLHQALHLAMPPHEGAGHRRVRCCSQDERTGPERWKFFQDELLEEKRNSCSKHSKLEILGFPSFGGLRIQVSGLQILEMVGCVQSLRAVAPYFLPGKSSLLHEISIWAPFYCSIIMFHSMVPQTQSSPSTSMFQN